MRFALYFAPPPESRWWRFGCDWLGRDARTDRLLPQPLIDGVPPAELARLTAAPRRYGFHATLRPPMRLRDDCTRAAFVAALGAYCRNEVPIDLPPLEPAMLDGFLALVTAHESPAVDALILRLAAGFERFRAPPTAAERAHRLAKPLTGRFHLSLTGSVADTPPEAIEALMRAAAARLPAEPVTIDAVCVFEERGVDVPLVLAERIAFAKRD